MTKITRVVLEIHNALSWVHLFGVILLFLGLVAVKPMLTMTGTVIIVGMGYISLRLDN
jgi:hypothetical protein